MPSIIQQNHIYKLCMHAYIVTFMHATQVCSNCTQTCRPGERLSGYCDGTTNRDSVTCVPCMPGTYSLGGMSTACTQCQGGFYSEYKFSACIPCPVGTWSPHGSSVCTSCTEWTCSPGEFRSVCTGSQAGACSVVPRWMQVSVSPLYLLNGTSFVPQVTSIAAMSSATTPSPSTPVNSTTTLGGVVAYVKNSEGVVTFASTSYVPKLSHHAAAALPNGIIFIFGGRLQPSGQDSTYQRSDSLYGLHLAYASVPAWWQIASDKGRAAPSSREMHAMAAVGNIVYVCGGLGGASSTGRQLADLWMYVHISSSTAKSTVLTDEVSSADISFVGNWTLLANAALPDRISQHKMVSTPDGKLWLFGGKTISERVLDKLLSLDTKNESAPWTVYSWNTTSYASDVGNSSNSSVVVAQPAARKDHGMAAAGYTVCVSGRGTRACFLETNCLSHTYILLHYVLTQKQSQILSCLDKCMPYPLLSYYDS
jgi:hypothetical protein